MFADIDPRTLNLDPAAVEAAITPRTKAIVAVDIFGYPCELDALRAICERHGLALIQDACEALGAEYQGAPVGSHGRRASSRSIRTSRSRPARAGWSRRTRRRSGACSGSLRNQGRGDDGGWLEHVRLGYNYRLDDVRAALGIGQLEKLDEILRPARDVAARYGELLRDIDGVDSRSRTTPTTCARGSSMS